MKASLLILGLCLSALVAGCETKPSARAAIKLGRPVIVEAACGQCQLGLKEKKGCDLAIRNEGKSYFVDGFKMDDLGDAHAVDGLCNAVRKAKVTGQIANGRFAASTFELLPVEKPCVMQLKNGIRLKRRGAEHAKIRGEVAKENSRKVSADWPAKTLRFSAVSASLR